MPARRSPWALLVLTLLSGCGGAPGPECQRLIREFERICDAEGAPPSICSEEFVRQIKTAKRQKSTPEAEEICRENADIFAEIKTR